MLKAIQKKTGVFLLLSLAFFVAQAFSFLTKPNAGIIYRCSNGNVSFLSDAPLEDITAKSKELKGAIDTEGRTFLFSVEVSTFQGFNSGLQEEHFNENYLETSRYPKVTFQGKIVEDVDLAREGTYEVRAKGMLDIHGIKQERIIKGTITVHNEQLTVDANFTVLLEDHDIKIPRVVYQKISPEIEITLNAAMERMIQN
jgi:polyisoprenoid-binding protein YceI